jgi:mRNA-degrading endonuclease RelE of RelBE toxin-antitoxin system
MRIVATPTYERAAKRLLSNTERIAAETEIATTPERWPVIAGTGGARKARIALQGRGKRGGARVVYFVSLANGFIAFIEIYAKNVKEDLSHADKRDIAAAIKELTASFGSFDAG